MNSVSNSQYGLTDHASSTLTRIMAPASTSTARSTFMAALLSGGFLDLARSVLILDACLSSAKPPAQTQLELIGRARQLVLRWINEALKKFGNLPPWHGRRALC